jgi:hypothetical protein
VTAQEIGRALKGEDEEGDGDEAESAGNGQEEMSEG